MPKFLESLSVAGDILPAKTSVTIGATTTSMALVSSANPTIKVGAASPVVLWHAGNDGSGSGLDADKLDGQEGSYYSSYTNLTSRTHVLASTSGLGSDHSVSGLTAGQVLRATGATTAAFQALTSGDIPSLAASKITSGTLAVARGGTGIASYTTNNYIRASGATTLQQRTPAQVLSDIGALASSDYTAEDILTKVKTVDGASSGLDADLLDGQHGSYYNDLGNATGTLSNDRLAANSITASKLTLTDLSNMALNPAFEDGVDSWGNTENEITFVVDISSDADKPANKAIELVGATTYTSRSNGKPFSVEPGQSYYFSFWAKRKGSNANASFQVAMTEVPWNTSPSYKGVTAPSSAPDNTWVFYSGVITINPDKRLAQSYIQVFPNASPTGSWQFTALTIRKAADAELIVDGAVTADKLAPGVLPQLSGKSGGTDGKVVRYSSADTFTDAANTDTPPQLFGLVFKAAGKYYTSGNSVTGLTGLTAGDNYWLGTSGSITSTPPVPSSTVTAVYIGKALSTTELLFVPGAPVGG